MLLEEQRIEIRIALLPQARAAAFGVRCEPSRFFACKSTFVMPERPAA